MIWSNLALILRSLWKYKLYSFTAIIGFGAALAITTLAAAFLINELKTDDQAGRNVFRVLMIDPISNEQRPITYYELPQIIRESYPEVDKVTHVVYRGYQSVKIDRQSEHVEYLEKGALFCDNNFLFVFSLPLLAGNAATALREPNSIVLSEDFALKYFGRTDVVNETLLIYDIPYKITGVLKAAEYNSHLKTNLLISYATLPKATKALQFGGFTYVTLKDALGYSDFERKLDSNPKSLLSYNAANWPEHPFSIQSIKDCYFYNEYPPHLLEVVRFRNPAVLKMYAGVAIAIFLVAFVNFIIYFFSKSVASGKQFFIKRIYGVTKWWIAVTYSLETFIILFVALLLALSSSLFLIPLFNTWAYSNIPAFFAFTPAVAGALAIIVIVTSAFTGLVFHIVFTRRYSQVTPATASQAGGFGLLRVLLIAQLSFASGLTVFFLLIKDQLDSISNYPMGFNSSGLVEIDLGKLPRKVSPQYLKQEFLKQSNVQAASVCFGGPLTGRWSRNFTVDGVDADCGFYQVDEDFVPTMGIKMNEGGNFENYTSNDSSYLLVNETGAKFFKIKNIDSLRSDLPIPGKVVGVFKDFHYASLENRVGPVFFMYTPYDSITEEGGKLLLRLHNSDAADLVNLENIWRTLTGLKFDYSVVEDGYNEFYIDRANQSSLLSISVISILVVTSFGVIGFTSFAAQRRMKETAIRKVLGASEKNIYTMWVRSLFLTLIGAAALSTPFAFYFFEKWTSGIVYKIPISTFTVPLAILLVGSALFASAFYHVFTASTQNVARVLKQD